MKTDPILIAEDDTSCQVALRRILELEGYTVTLCSRITDAKDYLQKNAYSMLLCDLHLPDGDGLDLMDFFHQMNPQAPSIILTGFGSIDRAVEATKKGAFNFIQKPFDKDQLVLSIRNALEQYRLKRQNQLLKKLHQPEQGFERMIGQSAPMKDVFTLIEKVSDSDSTILIRGESGTGKELIARAIHERSHRHDHLLVPINCGAIPKDLLESELFGHMKGAFTGAISNRAGRFEVADGGTLFLDEIGEMSPSLQVKLLRVLQDQAFEPIGSTRTIRVDVRIIAATNQNLETMIQEKTFREDLFYRLNVIPIFVPPLRERKDDIPLLCSHFCQLFNKQKKRQLEGLSPDALSVLAEYPWPGNVRELENLIERLVILKGEGLVTVEDLPEKIRNRAASVPNRAAVATALTPQSQLTQSDLPAEGIAFNEVVDQFENKLILQALERTRWNRNRAASLLGLNRTTLVEKLKKKGLRPPESTSTQDLQNYFSDDPNNLSEN